MKTLQYSLFVALVSLVTSASAQDNPFGNRFWTIASVTINPPLDVDLDGKPDTDLLILVPTCEKDDAERYQDDGLIIIDRGTKLCEGEDEKIEEFGTWSFNDKTKELIIDHYDSEKAIVTKVQSASSSEIV